MIDAAASRRPSLAALSLRLSSRLKRSNLSQEADVISETAYVHPKRHLNLMLMLLDRQRLWESILALPEEITCQILCYLSLSDILALRLTSRSVSSYLQCHAGPITRSILLQNAYEYATDYEGNVNDQKGKYLYNYIQAIYPPPQPCVSFDYMLQMLKRQNQVQRMLQAMTNWIQMKVYVFPKFKKCDNFNPYKFKLMRRLHVAAWTIYHFLEKYRTILVSEHPDHLKSRPGRALPGPCLDCVQSTGALLRTYPGKEIIPAYHFYELCRQHLQALSRAPSAGRIRGRKQPSDADLIQFIVFGGMPELCKLSLLKGSSNQRIDTIGNFVDRVSSAAIQQRIRANTSSSSSRSDIPSLLDDLVAPLQTPYSLIHHNTISALPKLEHFVVDSQEWVTRMYQLVGPGDQIVSSWGFITNILMEKSEESEQAGVCRVGGADSDLDFLAPVKGFGI